MTTDRAAHEQNRKSWNAVTAAHNSHKGDQAAWFREGGNALGPESREHAGDVAGKRLVHLQCNCGQETLSFAQLGADVTGVDISDAAIDFARQLSEESGIPGTFYRDDVYDWLVAAGERGEQYDVAFSSYGAICWLSDLTTWARGIAAILTPGGRFALIEYHPSLQALEADWTPHYPAIGGKSEVWAEGIGDYVGFMVQHDSADTSGEHDDAPAEFQNPEPTVEFGWSVSEVVTSLLDAGLVLRTLREYPYSVGYVPFAGFKTLSDNRYTTPDDRPSIPMMYAVVAEKPLV